MVDLEGIWRRFSVAGGYCGYVAGDMVAGGFAGLYTGSVVCLLSIWSSSEAVVRWELDFF